jgi:hypothetical protein
VLVRESERLHKQEIVPALVATSTEKRTREETLEEYLVAMVVQHSSPSFLLSGVKNILDDYPWTTPALGKIVEWLGSKNSLQGLPQELSHAYDVCFLLPLPTFNVDDYIKEVEKTAQELRSLGLKKQVKELTVAITKAEKEGKSEEVERLSQTLSPLVAKLSQK